MSWLNSQSQAAITWQVLQALDDFPPSFLHGDAVLTEHQTKHHQGDELTGVGLLHAKHVTTHELLVTL